MASSLAERLRGIVGGGAAANREGGAGRTPDPAPESSAPSNAAEVLGGEWVARPEGRVLVVERTYGLDERYGRERVGDLVEAILAGGQALATLDPAWPAAAARPRVILFDLETTGLAGGAGTQAFLVGCGLVDEAGVRVRQFLLPGFEHERALLAEVAAWAAEEGCLVTFNGRTFDLPLIETRYLFHRLPFPLAGRPHLDMLHPARRLWKLRPSVAGPRFDGHGADEESCRLSVLERHLAGVHRIGDVPGFEIPSRYFQFVRDGNARPLAAVLEHNRLDLLSLAVVTARAARLIERGPAQAAHAWESVGLGRIYERAGADAEAEACYLHAAELAARVGREPQARAEALRRLARCRRRDGRPREAALAWEALLETPGAPPVLRLEAQEALAIHYEHRAKDLRTARNLVLDLLTAPHTESRRQAAAYRLERLERKLRVRDEGGLIAALERE